MRIEANVHNFPRASENQIKHFRSSEIMRHQTRTNYKINQTHEHEYNNLKLITWNPKNT